jgi:hypothetical protein
VVSTPNGFCQGCLFITEGRKKLVAKVDDADASLGLTSPVFHAFNQTPLIPMNPILIINPTILIAERFNTM